MASTVVIEKVHRTLNYYELDFKFLESFKPEDGNQFRELFMIINTLAKTRAKIRYQRFGEKAIFIQDVVIQPTDKQVIGKLRCVRNDILPEIMNTTTDEARGIDAAEEEGLVETTHFLIDYSKPRKNLVIEYNQFGSKIGDFVSYLQNIGVAKKALETVGFRPIIQNQLATLKSRINRCSEFKVKVHKDSLPEIEKLEKQLYSAMVASIEHFKSDFAMLTLKFDYKQKTETNEMNRTIFNLISRLIKKPENTEHFNTLTVKAEDSEKNNRLETFDLLIDKVKSNIYVEKKKRYRTLVSEDLFQQMKSEIIKKKIV